MGSSTSTVAIFAIVAGINFAAAFFLNQTIVSPLTGGAYENTSEILKIGVFYDTVEESLAANGFSPNRNGGNQGFLRKAA